MRQYCVTCRCLSDGTVIVALAVEKSFDSSVVTSETWSCEDIGKLINLRMDDVRGIGSSYMQLKQFPFETVFGVGTNKRQMQWCSIEKVN